MALAVITNTNLEEHGGVGTAARLLEFAKEDLGNVTRVLGSAHSWLRSVLVGRYDAADVDALTTSSTDAEMKRHAASVALYHLTLGTSEDFYRAFEDAEKWAALIKTGNAYVIDLEEAAGAASGVARVRYRGPADEKVFDRNSTLGAYGARHERI